MPPSFDFPLPETDVWVPISLLGCDTAGAREAALVVVGTNRPPHALLFEPDGTLAATLGREGEGPGEFSAVASVVPLGADSLTEGPLLSDFNTWVGSSTGSGATKEEYLVESCLVLGTVAFSAFWFAWRPRRAA